MTEAAVSISTPEVPESARERRRAYVAGLREAADFLEAHPDLIGPRASVTFYRFAGSKPELARLALMLGDAEKHASSEWYNVTRNFGPHVIQVTAAREDVCEHEGREALDD